MLVCPEDSCITSSHALGFVWALFTCCRLPFTHADHDILHCNIFIKVPTGPLIQVVTKAVSLSDVILLMLMIALSSRQTQTPYT